MHFFVNCGGGCKIIIIRKMDKEATSAVVHASGCQSTVQYTIIFSSIPSMSDENEAQLVQ